MGRGKGKEEGFRWEGERGKGKRRRIQVGRKKGKRRGIRVGRGQETGGKKEGFSWERERGKKGMLVRRGEEETGGIGGEEGETKVPGEVGEYVERSAEVGEEDRGGGGELEGYFTYASCN